MVDLLSKIISTEIVTIIVVQTFSLIGIHISNKKQLTEIRLQWQKDLDKMMFEKNRELEEQRLNKVYKPIIRIYERSNTKRYLIDSYYSEGNVLGNGIDDKAREEVEAIVNANIELLKVEYIKKFEDALMGLQEDEVTSYRNVLQTTQGQSMEQFLFDENKKFISSIEREAYRIEKMIDFPDGFPNVEEKTVELE